MVNNDHLDELSPALDILIEVISKFRKSSNHTIYLNIGINEEVDTYRKYKFTPGLFCDDFYGKLLKIFNNTNAWDNTQKDKTIYRGYEDNPLLFYEFGNNLNLKKKIILEYSFKYNNTPYDFQILVTENEFASRTECDKLTDKVKILVNEFSLKYNTFRMYEEEIEHDEHIEITSGVLLFFNETLKNNEYSNKYIAHDMLLKLRDVINLVEPIEKATIDLISHYP